MSNQFPPLTIFPLYYLNIPNQNWNPLYSPFRLQTKELITQNTYKNQLQEMRLKYEKLLLENQELKIKLQQFQDARKTKRIVKRRREEDIQRQIKCPYNNCSKQYASQVALNLHIKEKHNGGTKRQRQKFAKRWLLAQKRHSKLPEQNINLPPGYLQEFKNTILDHLQSDSQILYSQESS